MTVRSNSAADLSLQFSAVFAMDATATKNRGAAIQMGAAAILQYHAELMTSSDQPPALAAMLSNGEARSMFIGEIVAKFGTVHRVKGNDVKADDKADTNGKATAQRNALSQSLTLAIALKCGGFPFDYLPANKAFFVDANALILSDSVMGPGLALAAKGMKLIMLNGKGYSNITANEKTSTVYASAAQVIAIYKARAGIVGKVAAPKTATVNGATVTVPNGANVRDNADDGWDFGKLMVAAAKLLNKAADITAEGGESVAYSELPEDMRNALEAVLIFRDECKAADAAKSVKAA